MRMKNTIKLINWNDKYNNKRVAVEVLRPGKKRVVLFTNKWAKIPSNIYNLGYNALKGWISKQNNMRLVTVYENDKEINLSLLTKDYHDKTYNQYNKL